VRTFAAITLALLFVASLHAAAIAQDDAPRITETSLTPATATVGDRLTLRIGVDHPDGVTIEGPRFGDDFGGLEIVEAPAPSRSDTHTTITFTLTSFETGAITLPPLEVRYRGPGGAGSLMTGPRTVQVRSVLSPGDDALRPLKPQLSLSDGAPPAVVPVLFGATFIVLTLFGYWLIRRAIDARPAEPAPFEPALTPADRARQALDALVASGAAERDVRAHYARLAEIVRVYLSERFGFPGYAMTRREMERGMARAGIDRFAGRVTANLLEQCDAVQFAGFRPPPERIDADLTAAYEIVQMTEPAPLPTATPQGAGR
jgi:hypothetical protein